MIKEDTKSKIFEFCRFIIVGLTATLINLGTYYILIKSDTNSSLAYSIGYGVSLIFNYLLTLKFTFKTKHSNTKGAKFLFTHLFNYLLQLCILNVLLLGINENIAPILTQAISIPLSFLLVRRVVR